MIEDQKYILTKILNIIDEIIEFEDVTQNDYKKMVINELLKKEVFYMKNYYSSLKSKLEELSNLSKKGLDRVKKAKFQYEYDLFEEQLTTSNPLHD